MWTLTRCSSYVHVMVAGLPRIERRAQAVRPARRSTRHPNALDVVVVVQAARTGGAQFPEDILDQQFARGEIDEHTYTTQREVLTRNLGVRGRA